MTEKTYSDDGAICPYCGKLIEPGDDNYELYDEATDTWICGTCDEEFIVSVYVSHSWTTRRRES